ncbi:splicing factor 3A subunit 1 [Octopus bimaculoides]|uniref:Splicing factor 3A subunit 1 n=1 Tax=Octopus bimaculoides TaxID=37653 RepID=A0A0L8IC61_OCTBM|nr:splicing factor 3A subunit 1 [Octopus bimaculoides]|eukprot:XP_014777948.1 PREDICTED: splicing factor 3A subunit 1-like [Octopus bimaculoides]
MAPAVEAEGLPLPDSVPGPEEKSEEEKTYTRPVIGIIYPPPEVRNIVDKTASFVARNGPEFESRIRQNEVNNPKFNFLNPADPYHAYYQHKVKEFKDGKGQEPTVSKIITAAMALKPMSEPIKNIEPIIPNEPPAEFEFTADPPSISAFDLDVVKLTAQFVARNGRQFLTNLMNREQRNYQFDFLRPQHSLFNYFTKLVEQYTKILIPPKDLGNKLKKESQVSKHILEQVKYRVEWAKYQERERRKEEDALEKERIAYAQIDWHDFVVVETVDFQASEVGNLPSPTTPEEVGARVIQQERYEKGENTNDVAMEVESDEEDSDDIILDKGGKSQKDVHDKNKHSSIIPPPLPIPPQLRPPPPSDNNQVLDMDEGSDDDEMDEERKIEKVTTPQPPPPPPPPSDIPQPPPPLPPTPDQVIVRKDYNPKARTISTEPNPDSFMVSPITGEKIPTHKVPEHMRIGLLDRKWIEERNRSIAEKREQEEVYAPGLAIGSSLRQLAERRTDIFGIGAEETQIGKKIGEEEKKEKKVVWDGHTASMEKVTQKARENITIEEQIAVIHKVKGLVPDEEKEKIGPAMPKPSKPIHPPMQHPIPKPMPPAPISTTTISPNIMKIQPPPPPPVQPAPPMPPMPRPPVPQSMVILPPRPPPTALGNVLGISQRPPQPPVPQLPVSTSDFSVPPPPPKEDDQPTQSKRQKTEESLVSEEEYLRTHKNPILVKVLVPNVPDKPEWNLNGQVLNFTLPLTDSVSVIKAKLNEALSIPAGKQKLQYEGIFVKDSNTLAFYNLPHGASINLQLKERGGRKK